MQRRRQRMMMQHQRAFAMQSPAAMVGAQPVIVTTATTMPAHGIAATAVPVAANPTYVAGPGQMPVANVVQAYPVDKSFVPAA